MNRKLEICCYTLESAIIAEQAGADRIELCDNYSEGGTTPSYGKIKQTINKLNIPINVIVRPRGGDFLYTQNEFEIIKADVVKIRELGANGIVIGFLNKDASIDIKRTEEILNLGRPMEVTFHRAFDMCNDHYYALHQLTDIGVERILTSGGKQSAYEGMETLQKLVESAGDKIIVMPGSGINEFNIEKIMLFTQALEFHSSAKTFIKSAMEYYNENVSMSDISSIDEFKNIIVDENKIREMKKIIS